MSPGVVTPAPGGAPTHHPERQHHSRAHRTDDHPQTAAAERMRRIGAIGCCVPVRMLGVARVLHEPVHQQHAEGDHRHRKDASRKSMVEHYVTG